MPIQRLPQTVLLTSLLACAGAEPDEPAPGDPCAPARPPPPACGTGPVARGAVIPGPADADFDAAAHAHVARYDRLFDAFFAAKMGVSTEVQVPLDDAVGRADLAAIAAGERSEAPRLTGARWQKAAGAYAGVGIAADAYRYGALRDEGAPCAEVDAARARLVEGLTALHRASEITGVPGVIARGYAPVDDESYGALVTTVPLADADGAPLPAEKNNGTWREDNSGAWPGWRWEDSCSRDMLIGWTAAFAAIGEVADDTLPAAEMAALQADATAIARSLMTVQDSGYDLEIRDADGRMTYHGVMNEQAIDRVYAPGVENGLYAAMSLGAVAALARVADDPEVDAWLTDELLGERRLHEIVRDGLPGIDFGQASNYSNHNMGFLGGLLAETYLCDPEARAAVAVGVQTLYAIPGRDRQPSEQGQTLYDLAFEVANLGAHAFGPSAGTLDGDALDRGLATLAAFPAAPYWDTAHDQCDAAELEAGVCTATDGSTITLAPGSGRGDVPVADHALPFHLRPPSNYHWRSNPYTVNGGGDGSVAYPGVDLRFAWWLGRWRTR